MFLMINLILNNFNLLFLYICLFITICCLIYHHITDLDLKFQKFILSNASFCFLKLQLFIIIFKLVINLPHFKLNFFEIQFHFIHQFVLLSLQFLKFYLKNLLYLTKYHFLFYLLFHYASNQFPSIFFLNRLDFDHFY